MYTPDNWVILKIVNENETLYKVLGGWSGGYLHGDSWRMNSGIAEVKQLDDYFLFIGYSNSVYKCHKDVYTTRMNTLGVFENLKKQVEKLDNVTIELMPEDTDWLNLLNTKEKQ